MATPKKPLTPEEQVILLRAAGSVIANSHALGQALAIYPSDESVPVRTKRVIEAYKAHSAAAIEMSEAINDFLKERAVK